MTDTIIDVQAVNKRFSTRGGLWAAHRNVQAAVDVSFQVRRGDVFAVVGESGSGKTTLARMLLGLVAPDSGDIRLCGETVLGASRSVLTRRVQPVFQDPYSSLNPSKTIASIIGLPFRAARIGDRAEERRKVIEAMEMVSLPARLADRFPDELSGGQRQRVAIARALVSRPQIVICDEPTSALDVSVQAQILNLLDDLRAAHGLTYVLISHNMAVVEHLATHVAVMREGRIVEMGTRADVFVRPQHSYTQTLLSSALLTTDMWH